MQQVWVNWMACSSWIRCETWWWNGRASWTRHPRCQQAASAQQGQLRRVLLCRGTEYPLRHCFTMEKGVERARRETGAERPGSKALARTVSLGGFTFSVSQQHRNRSGAYGSTWVDEKASTGSSIQCIVGAHTIQHQNQSCSRNAARQHHGRLGWPPYASASTRNAGLPRGV